MGCVVYASFPSSCTVSLARLQGQNLILNMNDKGFVITAFNRTVSKVDAFLENEAKGTKVGVGRGGNDGSTRLMCEHWGSCGGLTEKQMVRRS